jgi:acetyl-CoA C-acetyltransferase
MTLPPGFFGANPWSMYRQGMALNDVVIIDGARTPVGKFNGSLSGFTATDLGGLAISEAMDRAGVSPTDVDYVLMGHVLLAGEGQSGARAAAVKAGLPMSTPAATINKVCLSGLNTIYSAAMMIALGEAEVVIAGGMESMSNAPYLLPKARTGYGYGHGAVHDSLLGDGLTCAVESVIMGEGTDRYSAAAALPREAQDAYAAGSHERAARATKDGILAEEIFAVEVPQRRGDPVVFSEDEGIRAGTDATSLGGLRPAFVSDGTGTVTAGNASQISDGGSAIVLTSRAAAERLGLTPLAEFVSYGQVAGPDNCSLLHQPSRAIKVALDKAGMTTEDVDVFEINEAFAAVALASMDELGITDENVNVNGGAISLGHPLGMSGNRLALTLAYELKRRGGGVGAAGLCGGGGQGDALIMRSLA